MKRWFKPRDLYPAAIALMVIAAVSSLVYLVIPKFLSMKQYSNGQGIGGPGLDIDDLMVRVRGLALEDQHEKALKVLLVEVEKFDSDSLFRLLLTPSFDLFLDDELKRGQEDIDRNGLDYKAYLRLSMVLELMGDDFRAMEVLLDGIAKCPKAIDLWMGIARLEEKAKRYREALAIFREVIKLDGSNGLAQNRAARIIATLGDASVQDMGEAMRLAKGACNLEPNNPHYLDTLAEVHLRQGQRDQAFELIRRAIELSSNKKGLKRRLIQRLKDAQ